VSHNVVQRSAIGARRHIRRIVTVVTAGAATGLGWAAGWLAYVDYVLQTPLGARPITLAVVVLMLSILPIFALRASIETRLALTTLHCLAAVILTAGLPQPR
jgi:hypothetical protein